jgi:hypothetical protein
MTRAYAGRALRFRARLRIGTPRAASAPLAAVLEETVLNALCGQRQAWIERIQALREELCSSRSEIEIADYGAESPQLALSSILLVYTEARSHETTEEPSGIE